MAQHPPPTADFVDRTLRQVRFAPRPSLEAELLSRLRSEQGEARNGLSAAGLSLVATALVGTLVFLCWVKLLTVPQARADRSL